MTILRLVFNVNVSPNSNGQGEMPYPTGNPELDAEILPGLVDDRINLISTVQFYLDAESTDYKFNVSTNQIEIRVTSVGDVTPEKLAKALLWFDPDGLATNGWMEGDINIVDYKVAQKFGYEQLELWPRIAYVGWLVPEPNSGSRNPETTYSEYEVDLSKLPHVD